jgi:hypothetical protein
MEANLYAFSTSVLDVTKQRSSCSGPYISVGFNTGKINPRTIDIKIP